MQEAHSNQLDPDEPHTPGWFSLLGLGLFLAAGIFFLATQDEEEPAAVPQQAEQAAPQPDSEQGAGEDPHE